MVEHVRWIDDCVGNLHIVVSRTYIGHALIAQKDMMDIRF